VARYDFVLSVPEALDRLGTFEPGLGVSNGVVVGISLNSGWVNRDFDVTLAGLLSYLGEPEEIWLEVGFDTPFAPHYELELFYPARGVLVNGTGFTVAAGDEWAICPVPFQRGDFPPGLVLWSSTKDVAHRDVMVEVLGMRRNGTAEFAPLEVWTDSFGLREFYTTFLDPQADACFPVHPKP
jgi:hypothetical protein